MLKLAFIIFLLMGLSCTRTIRLGSYRWASNSGKPFIRLARNEQAMSRQMNDDGNNFGYPNVEDNHQNRASGSSHHQITRRKQHFTRPMDLFATNKDYFKDAIWRLFEDRSFSDGTPDQYQIRLTK